MSVSKRPIVEAGIAMKADLMQDGTQERHVDIQAGDIHVWRINRDSTCADLYEDIGPDEIERARRFKHTGDMRRFISDRHALRTVLAIYTGVRPHDIRYIKNAQGKPGLSGVSRAVRFNVSHSGDVTVIVISTDAEVGVDIEQVRDFPYAGVVAEFFSEEEARVIGAQKTKERLKTFFSLWTVKEACCKVTGAGTSALENCEILNMRIYSVFSIDPAPGYVGTVAVEGIVSRLKILDLRL